MRTRISTLLIVTAAMFTAAMMMAPAAGATFHGNNGVIAFNGPAPENHDIWTINPDGTGMVSILHNSDSNFSPTYSADGTRIVFTSTLSGNDDIWIMNANGTGLQRLTKNAADDLFPTFNPAGTKIAFESNRSGQFNLYVMNLGTGKTKLLAGGAAHLGKPDWMGSRVAFERTVGRTTNIWTVSVKTDAFNQITHYGAGIEAGHPTFSPDGKMIAYSSNVSGDFNLYWMNANGTGTPTRLTNESSDDLSPAFSPNGALVAFNSDRLFGVDNIFYVDINTLVIHPVTNQSSVDYRNPGWQPLPI